MIQSNTVCTVTNRSNSTVIYNIPEDNIRREFSPRETKKIKFGELEKLSYRPGGDIIIEEYLIIGPEEALKALEVKPEPEYFLTEAELRTFMPQSSMDEFLDMLEYAPEGVLELVKTLAVSLPLTDTEKLEAIRKATGFNASAAIQHNKEENTTEANEEKPVSTGRRTEPKYKTATTK